MSATGEALASRDAVLTGLTDNRREISEIALGAILDAYRHDRAVHRALIARRVLPTAIIERLIRLVASRADLDRLLARHAVAGLAVEDLRAARPRPVWWRSGIMPGMR